MLKKLNLKGPTESEEEEEDMNTQRQKADDRETPIVNSYRQLLKKMSSDDKFEDSKQGTKRSEKNLEETKSCPLTLIGN